jgi:hypothetical protein
MVAAFPPLLSDQPPDLAKRAEFGGRFHYWRGYSGRRYLFSVVPPESLADFRSAVVILAESAGGGRLAARAFATLDDRGRPGRDEGPWPPRLTRGAKVLVHFLAVSDADRRHVIDDMTGALSVRLAA